MRASMRECNHWFQFANDSYYVYEQRNHGTALLRAF